jgi:hypothetical protein
MNVRNLTALTRQVSESSREVAGLPEPGSAIPATTRSGGFQAAEGFATEIRFIRVICG